jgi:hypothetical protein
MARQRIIEIYLSAEIAERARRETLVILGKCGTRQIQYLIKSLQNGTLNGCVTSGPRSDLYGTLAKASRLDREDILRQVRAVKKADCKLCTKKGKEKKKGCSNTQFEWADYWFFQICTPGNDAIQTPDNNQFVKRTIDWCTRFLNRRRKRK